jgi:CBS domain-containing membrane protein
MLEHNLKAIPVIDRARRVIGMITRHDFFKFIELHPYQTLADRLHTFIRRTRDIETHKPEAVGHLMTTTVITCAGNSHIVELIPLMSQAGHKQIPIIDNEQRLIGMVYQVDLVKVLYQQVIAKNRI